ncbi:MAG: glycosyltransferase family 39 protein [Bryobacterales bacterium]|nr:glycosyltransferase family 39 protein [Bryobacterales bacterium]
MTQRDSNMLARLAANVSRLRSILAALFIGGFFLFFTWRGLLIYFTGDDLMNLYGYWSKPVSALVKGNLLFWTPYYRPFGGVIYRTFFAVFGFNPYPLYVLFFAAMLLNLWLAYLVLKRLGGSAEIGVLATLLFAFHGKLDYLYYNAGSMYDVFCFMFSFLALLIYLRARERDRFLSVWGTLAFLACFICALNSKEMAATLPVIVLLYELIFHPPNFRSIPALVRWAFHEGRMALLGALCVLIYLPAKLSSSGLAATPAYIPSYTWARYLGDTETYLGYLLYRSNPFTDLGVTPLTPLGVAAFYGLLIAIALWMRSRVVWFGLLFFVVTLLPVSFVTARLGFVLYLPLAGLALATAVCLVRFKEGLWKTVSASFGPAAPSSSAASPSAAASFPSAAVALFLATALVLFVVDSRNWPVAPNPQYSPYKTTIADFSRLYPHLPHGSKLLFARSSLDSNWDLVFLLRLYYRDTDLFLTQMNGPPAQRIPADRLPHYDHVFDFIDGHYVELQNSDPVLAMQLHLVKQGNPRDAFGETMTIGRPGASQYVVKDVLVGDPKSDGYWTLDNPEFNFLLSSSQDRFFWERFYLPLETLKQTGPLIVDFYVNGHYLDQARFAKDGEVVYQHEVPADWLRPRSLTNVRMHVHNPYIAPRDKARLGVLLRAAGFKPMSVTL